MEYHQDTARLIDRIRRTVERTDSELNKEDAQERVLKTYDLFGLPRPKGVEWVKISDIFPNDEYFLKYECPSTGRVYVKCVELQTLNGKPHADSCQAWSFNISLDEYCNLGWEA